MRTINKCPHRFDIMKNAGLCRVEYALRKFMDSVIPCVYDRVCKHLIALLARVHAVRADQGVKSMRFKNRLLASNTGHFALCAARMAAVE